MLSAENLDIQRNGREILKQINLEVKAGQIIGVLGSNGAGKSSLLSALCGDLTTSNGQINLHDKPLGQWSARQRAQHLAVLPQHSNLTFGFTAEQVIAMGRLPHDSSVQENQEIVEQVLDKVDGQHLRGRNYLQLSGGERQRVHLARVLAQLWPSSKQRVLLLDEPTSMLDPLHQHSTLQAVREFAEQGGAVFIVLHDLNLAARYCDQLVLLHAGKVFASGTVNEVLQASFIYHVFGLEVIIQPHPEQDYPVVIAK